MTGSDIELPLIRVLPPNEAALRSWPHITTRTAACLTFLRASSPLTIQALALHSLFSPSLAQTPLRSKQWPELPYSEPGDDGLTRTHKTGDRDHVGLANGTAAPEEHLPRYFGKSGYAGTDPRDTKKQGGGKGNWGREGEELEDYNYNMAKPRRRTNSMSAARTLKTKFEDLDPEAIDYEEDLHGPSAADYEALEKMSTSSSADTMGSVDEEEEHVADQQK